MTLAEAINKIDELKPNSYSQLDKVSWLSTLDGMVKRQIIDTHSRNSDEDEITFSGYDEDTDLDTEMLIYPPYEETYIFWLEAKIDYTNGEYDKYNNSMVMFNGMYGDFSNDYNRHHMPKGSKIKYF